jgi:hypothetical protein
MTLQDPEPATTWGAIVLREAGQLICGTKGHAYVRHFEPDRMRLVCSSCGYQSPGWQVERQSQAA